MPAVLRTSITINHGSWLFLADFHKANPFQIADQMLIITIRKIKGAANSAYGILFSCFFYLAVKQSI